MSSSEGRLFLSADEAAQIAERGGVSFDDMNRRDEVRVRWIEGGKTLMVDCKSVEQRRVFQKRAKGLLNGTIAPVRGI